MTAATPRPRLAAVPSHSPATQVPNANAAPQPPNAPGEWSLCQIQNALKRPIPPSLLSQKVVDKKGTKVAFLPWYTVNSILDKYAPGWSWQITSLQFSGDRLFLSGRLTIPTADGDVCRDAAGTETLKDVRTDYQTGEVIAKEHSYGDPSSNAESMAFRRAAARFGLALDLYDK